MDIKPNHLSTVGAETNAPDRERWRGIAEMLFPNWRELPSLAQLEERYPARVLPEGAMVTRLGPSPTGMMHIGGLYVGLINHKLAHQTQGLFFLRVEDTDTKRSVEGAYETIVNSLIDYGLTPDEGPVRDPAGEFLERGAYGPYVQTARKTLYHACAFDLIGRGAMYPCFMSESELEAIRTEQRAAGLRSGVYGLWAKSRQLTFDEIEARIRAGAAFVLRLRSMGDPNRTVNWNDGVRGTLSLPEYDVDAVLIKSDGIPTYHFAHLVDDHLMRSTHVIRAEEWVSSVPLHLQLFSLMGWAPPQYAHISAIQKFGEAGGKRKLSKRTDPEADVQFYWSNGFPTEAVIDYLMNLANSDFEDWRRANPEADYTAFSLTLEKMGVAGPVADMVKLESISREVLSRMSTARLYECSQLWTATFDPELAAEMRKDPDYACRALNIERNPESSAKRLVTLKSLRANLGPFYDRFLPDVRDLPFPAQIPAEDRNRILAVIRERFQETDPPEQFFERLKGIAAELGFAPTVKEYKKNAERFKGHVGDVAMIVRVAIFGSSNSPDLGQVMHVLGRERVVKRCERAMTA